MFDSEKLGLKKVDSVGESQGTHSSGVVESSSFLGSQSLPMLLSKESEHIDTSLHTLSSGLDDYIPLSTTTPERFDPTNSRKGLLETGTWEDTKWNPPPLTFCVDLSSEALIVPMPFGARDPNKAMSVSSSDQVQCDDSSQTHLSGTYSRVKDLYSDTEGKRPSVFSRLKLDSTAAVEEDEDKSEVTESVHEIMEKLQQSHDNMKKSTAKTESFSRENTVLTQGKKASVFARLKVASKDSVDEKEVHTQVEKSTRRVGVRFQGKKKKRGREVLISSDECGNFNMTIQVRVGKEASQVEEVQEKEERDTVDGGLGVFSSEEQQKRRRLESVVVNEIGCGCLNVQMLSQESSSGKENGESCKGSNKSERPEDNETGVSQKDLVHAVICPTYRGEEQGKDLNNSDSLLRVQDVGGNNYCNKVGTRPLVTYQRRHKLFLR